MRRKVKQPFILTPETPYAVRKDQLACWYPFWNADSAYYPYDFYLDCVLWQTEQELAADCEYAENIMASRAKFQYRVPSNPSEETFCRGQF